MDIIELILHDHREISDLFEHLGEVAHDDRMSSSAVRTCARLVVAAKVHMLAEERVLYEALRTGAGMLKAFALAGPHEHETLDITLDKLVLHRPSEELQVIVRVARDLFDMHARDEEEAEILPLVRDVLPADELVTLGRDYASMKARLRPQVARMVALPARAA